MSDIRTQYGQAAHIVGKLGWQPLAEITGRNRTRILNWRNPQTKGGSDGLVPTKPAALLWLAMERGELALSPEDFAPRPVTLDHSNHPGPLPGPAAE